MSVDFYPEIRDEDFIGFRLVCGCGDATTGNIATTYNDAVAVLTLDPPRCGDEFCDAMEQARTDPVRAVEGPRVNVSSANGRMILELLGIDADEALAGGGAEDAQAFLGRVLTALAIAPADEGIPAHEVAGPGPRWVECGRRPGYAQDVLTRLHEVAEWAAEHDRMVVWA